MPTLVIVESPGTVKRISALLGPAFKVVASIGHVRDLPRKALGLEPLDLRPHYQPTECGREVLARLKKEVVAPTMFCWRPTARARRSRGNGATPQAAA